MIELLVGILGALFALLFFLKIFLFGIIGVRLKDGYISFWKLNRFFASFKNTINSVFDFSIQKTISNEQEIALIEMHNRLSFILGVLFIIILLLAFVLILSIE